MRLHIGTALPAMFLLVALPSVAQAQQEVAMKAGSVAPPFRTKTLEGKTLTLKSLRGQVVLMDVWATWCGPCRLVMPIMQSLHQKYGGKGLKVIGLSLDDDGSLSQIASFRKNMKLTYTFAVSPKVNAKIATSYNAEALPSVVLIDRKGIVRWSQRGFSYELDEEKRELNQRVSELLAESPPPAKIAANQK